MFGRSMFWVWICVIIYFNVNDLQAGPEYLKELSVVPSDRNKRETMVPEVYANVSWSKKTLLSSGDELAYKFCIQHASFSTADAFNVHLKWLFPLYISFRSVNQTFGPEASTNLHSSVVEFKVVHLPQDEIVCFNLTFIFNPSAYLRPGRHFIVTHTLLVWKAVSRETENSSVEEYASPWDAFCVDVEVPGCSNELGIGSGKVKDYQMTSSSYKPGHEAFKARMNSSTVWCSSVLNLHQFLQIDFIHQVTITKMAVKGQDTYIGVTQYILQHSIDGQNWRNYTEFGTIKVFHCTLSKDVVTTHWILNPFEAYSIRIRPTHWNQSMCLAVELHGCEDKQSQASCNLPLGMESGFITDDALSTSQSTDNPEDSRLNKIVPRSPAGWLASLFVPEDYLQIDLAVLHQITKIGVQGEWTDTQEANHFVKKYTVMLSNDSITWFSYVEDGNVKVLDGPSNSAMAVYPTFAILRPVVTRYLRIFPQRQEHYRIMRLEIYGCLKEPRPSYQVPNDFSRRSYLLNNKTGDFYVCLYTDDRTESSCMTTTDSYSWKGLSPRIVNVLAVDISDGTIYALDRSNSYLLSSDSCRSWMTISLSQWTKVKTSSHLILASEVHENLLAKDHTDGLPVLTLKSGLQWTVSNTGVHVKRPGEDWIVAATWKCCTG